MAQTTFYAARADEVDVLRFVFDETDCHVYEAYSRPDQELRRFVSLADLRHSLDVGSDRPPEARTILLDLWSPATRGEPTVHRYELELKNVSFRYEIGGWGLFRLQLGGGGNGVIGDSWFSHNSESRARTRASEAYRDLAPPDTWDWDAVTKLGRRIIHHLRNRLAVGRAGSAAVLAVADELRRSGWLLR